jgi:hypothetical protein
MDYADLKDQLNSCRAPQYTRVADLRPGIPYRIVKFDKCCTRFGDTVAAILEGLVGDDYFLRVYLPQRFLRTLTDAVIEHYNSAEGTRLSLQYRGGTSDIEFV